MSYAIGEARRAFELFKSGLNRDLSLVKAGTGLS